MILDMKHEAIYALYPTVIRTAGNGADIIAHDAKDKVVLWDASAVETKATELLNAAKLDELRTERNKLLSETDWWDMSDTAAMTDAQKKYRQDLRDITKTATSLDDVTWPEKP